ncbi:MAG: helix-hairpin-helix domain-containing protein [Oscillospiraceae bacterium]|nr:helix-hairpin-helix domain-containing protein [Oscillospiraceae bacterium]
MDLNTASCSDLERLPGIGTVRAQDIIDWRQEHGPFSSVDDLKKVKGIGAGVLEQILPYVKVS